MREHVFLKIEPDKLAGLIRVNGWINRPTRYGKRMEVIENVLEMAQDGQAELTCSNLMDMAETIADWTRCDPKVLHDDIVADIANAILEYSTLRVEIF